MSSGDNDISLREHMQRQVDALERHVAQVLREHRIQLDERYATQTKALEAAFSAAEQKTALSIVNAERAVTKAEAANEKRFESVNEFRAQLGDQSRTFMPRAESIQRHDATGERIAVLEKRMSEQIQQINSRLDRTQGTSQGIDKAWGYVVGIVGLAGGVVALVIALTQ